MSYLAKKYFLIFCIILISNISVYPKTIWKNKNLYSAANALKAGDILNVIIDDTANIRFVLTISNNNTFAVNSSPDGNITPFLKPFNSNKQSNKNSNTNVNHNNNIKINLPVIISNVLKNGNYAIHGLKTYKFNENLITVSLSGIISPLSIKGNNVHSNDIANLILKIETSKKAIDLKIPETKEGETAKYDISEDDKQKIITQYLQRLLSEISEK